jgi:hypothetical protein
MSNDDPYEDTLMVLVLVVSVAVVLVVGEDVYNDDA